MSVKYLAVGASALVATLGLWLSFVALSTLAGWAGWGPSEAAAMAIVVDGLIVVATLSVYSLESGRIYAWGVFIAWSLVSLSGNVTHAILEPGRLDPILSALIAAAPPLAHLIATHLTVKLIRQDSAAAPEVVEIATPEPIAEPAPVRPDPVEVPAPARAVEAVPDLVDTPAEDAARAHALAQLAAKQVTQAQVAEQFGVHVRTVRRWQAAA
ncbi:helix-turn-helix domain-containing protein [Rhodococcus opacus]|uniref:helix-turn-helix domain-containing protein n=1 Tax=Rhodococcus opacus TaxID=37919 RepID=UPI001C463A2E|nr:helix-turn-helix domain-containing protein [Rhodococcus opacus]MBV6758340.1 helix-turn-helix domain containing protein [Rhodococcus opacus]